MTARPYLAIFAAGIAAMIAMWTGADFWPAVALGAGVGAVLGKGSYEI